MMLLCRLWLDKVTRFVFHELSPVTGDLSWQSFRGGRIAGRERRSEFRPFYVEWIRIHSDLTKYRKSGWYTAGGEDFCVSPHAITPLQSMKTSMENPFLKSHATSQAVYNSRDSLQCPVVSRVVSLSSLEPALALAGPLL